MRGRHGWLIRFARAYERQMAELADGHICVTNAMRLWLKSNWGIRCVLHDKQGRGTAASAACSSWCEPQFQMCKQAGAPTHSAMSSLWFSLWRSRRTDVSPAPRPRRIFNAASPRRRLSHPHAPLAAPLHPVTLSTLSLHSHAAPWCSTIGRRRSFGGRPSRRSTTSSAASRTRCRASLSAAVPRPALQATARCLAQPQQRLQLGVQQRWWMQMPRPGSQPACMLERC
jgi:hypothetical protein